MDGHAVPLRLPRLPVPAVRLHPAEGRLLQLVPRHDLTRQNHHQHHRPLNPKRTTTRKEKRNNPSLKSDCRPHRPVPTSVPSRSLLEYYWTLKAHWPGWQPLKWARKERKSNPLQCLFRSTSDTKQYLFFFVLFLLRRSPCWTHFPNSPCTKVSL